MSAVPVASYLIDFGAAGGLGADCSHRQPGASKVDGPASRVEEAYSRGFEQGRAAAEAACNEEIERRRIQFEQQLAAARHEWAAETGAKLSEQLIAGLGSVEEKIANTAASLLKPVLIAEFHRQAIAELLEVLREMVSKGQGITFNVSGPEDLLKVLSERLAGEDAAVTFSPGDGCDVRVAAGQTILETRLSVWVAKIEEAIG
jgi:hypothetical protein